MTPKGEHLFPELNKARYGEARCLRPLFLPNLLQQEPKKLLEEQAQNAYQIICKWADIESGGTEKIAMWMLDTDYDGRSVYPKQVFFPMADQDQGWARLARNLKAEIDPELIEAYRGTVSLPFAAGDNKRIAVKIIDDRGIESLRIMEL